MKPSAVALAVSTALDVDAARQLRDYGDLDDAGVARALEQVHMQRWGRTDCPAHLLRINALAAVIESGRQLRRVELRATNSDEEARLLSTLFEHWPRMEGAVVDWQNQSMPVLMARACRHGLVIPPTLASARQVGLVEHVAPMASGHPADREAIEREYCQLQAYTLRAGSLADRAVARYRTWLAWQTSQGEMMAAERDARVSALERELAGQA